MVALGLVEIGREHLKLHPRVDIFRAGLEPCGVGS